MTSSADDLLREKFDRLLTLLQQTGSAVLAFSGGVDSSLLLKALQLSGMRFLAVTAVTATMPDHDRNDALAFARQAGADHLVIHTNELSDERFTNNPPDRCFYCKDELFRKLRSIADEQGYGAVLDGSNADDLTDYRPGMGAARLHGVISPLAECGMTKADIRGISRTLGLPTWNRPSSPCLSTRIAYGQRITAEDLHRIGKAEDFLISLGITGARVRLHGDLARIEVSRDQMENIMTQENRLGIASAFRSLGFAFVSLDLEGYRSGSMNRVLPGGSRLHS